MIIGITGTFGAGKGTVVEYLVKEKGFRHYSARAFIAKEVERRGLVVSLESLTKVANILRAEHQPSYIIEELYKEAKMAGGDSVIESLRAVGEVQALRRQPDFILLAVDADRRIRYDRICERKSAADNVTFEKFCEIEDFQMKSDDPNKQNLSACIAQADFSFNNNGTPEELFKQIEEILSKLT